jgi:uncharacterized protein YndB with AHSA1/START domain
MISAVSSRVDTALRTAVITTSFDHPVDIVWTLFSDPTKLARWWGPPGMPMSIERHDLRPGGTIELTVTTGDAEIRGRWNIHEVDAPHTLKFTFASDGLEPTEVTAEISAASDDQTLLTIMVRFASDDALSDALDIGFVDGVTRSCSVAHDAIQAT